MPTQNEKVALVEVALRQRFLPFVPKIEKPQRNQWTEDQHETDQLTRALAAYTLVAMSHIEDGLAVGAITDEDDDGGIDAFYFDRVNGRLVVVQSKFKRTGAGPAQDENLKTINGIRDLMARRFEKFNRHFQQRADEIEEALDHPGIEIVLALAFLGDNLSPHVTADLNALASDLNEFYCQFRWESCGVSVIHGWLVSEQTPSSITMDVSLENWNGIITPYKAFYGQICATELARLVEEHGTALFDRNIRHYLGSVGVNTAIENTVSSRPRDLFYLNNGLTAVAESIVPASANKARCNFRLTNFSIVNGAQTAGSVSNAALSGEISPDAKLLMTVIEIGSQPNDLQLRITEARNRQNAVRGSDFATLDPQQERLRREIKACGMTYHYRTSAEALVQHDDAFTLEEASLASACLTFPVLSSLEVLAEENRGRHALNAIEFAVMAKREPGRLWDRNGSLYPQFFNANVSGVRLCRMVQVYRFLDRSLDDNERNAPDYRWEMLYRHGRLFIMPFVAHRVPTLMNRLGSQLSEDEKMHLSREVDLVATLVYVASSSWNGVKGYLAIFRNMTDAQPLADAVLQALEVEAAKEAALLAAAPTTNGANSQ